MTSSGFTVRGEVRDSIWQSLAEIWRFRPLIAELVQRDLKIRYKNRVGGILWSLFAPLMQVLTIYLMVRFFLTPISNFSVYLLAVMFLWQFFLNTVLDCAASLVSNAALARKIYFPRAILPLVAMTSNFIHFGICFAFTVVYFFVMPRPEPIFPQNLRPEFLLVFPIALSVGLLGLGIGYLMAYLTTLYDDVRFLNVTFFSLLFYAVPILYPIERVAAQSAIYPFYMANPLAALLVGYQRAMLPPLVVEGTTPVPLPYDWLGVAMLSSVFICWGGFYIFERSKWKMMERL